MTITWDFRVCQLLTQHQSEAFIATIKSVITVLVNNITEGFLPSYVLLLSFPRRKKKMTFLSKLILKQKRICFLIQKLQIYNVKTHHSADFWLYMYSIEALWSECENIVLHSIIEVARP